MLAGPSTTEVVRYAGGWLFDRVIAGWDVTVLTEDAVDARALRILGATPVELGAALAVAYHGPRPHAVAVAAGLYASDERIRTRLHEAVDNGLADARLWDDTCRSESDAEHVPYRPTAAARAFKAQALAAAAAPVDACEATELFQSVKLLRSYSGV